MVDWTTTAFVFPGQGSQAVGMGKDFAENYPIAEETFQQANDILGYDLKTLCFEGPKEELDQTNYTQPALFVSSMAILRVLQQENPDAKPQAVAGHSLGELTAVVTANALTFEDGLKLVHQRGTLMQSAGEKNPGAMAAILALDEDKVQEICVQASEQTGKQVILANMNCPGQYVISGDVEALEAALPLLKDAGAKRAMQLPVSIAAHSPLMSVVSDEYRQAVGNTPFSEPNIPIYANHNAQAMTTISAIQDELANQLTHPVNWTTSVQNMIAAGIETFVEIGSGNVLTGLLRRIDRSKTGIALRDVKTLGELTG